MCAATGKASAFACFLVSVMFVLAALSTATGQVGSQLGQPISSSPPRGVSLGGPGAVPDYQRVACYAQQSMGYSQHDGTFCFPEVDLAPPSISGHQSWNACQELDIAVSNYRGYRSEWRATAATLGAISPPPIGSVTTMIPLGVCALVFVGGSRYFECGGVYYRPTYQGSTVVYEVVNPPW